MKTMTEAMWKALEMFADHTSHGVRSATVGNLVAAGLVTVRHFQVEERVRAGRVFGAPYKTVYRTVRDVRLTEAGRAALAARRGQ